MTPSDRQQESDTKRDGAFSYSAEWHAFAHGVYRGMRTWRSRPGEPPDIRDVQKEPHYYKGGYVAGTVLQLGIVLLLLLAGKGMV